MSDSAEHAAGVAQRGNDYHAKINRTRLVEYLDAVGAIVDEARLEITDDRWLIEATDPANVAAGIFEIPKSEFGGYRLAGSDIEIGLHIGGVQEALEKLPEVEIIHVGINRKDEQFELATGGYSHSAGYIDPDKIRDWSRGLDDYDSVTVDVHSGGFADAIEYLASLQDKLSISYTSNDSELWLETSDGIKSGSVYLDIQSSPEGGDAASLYSKDYLNDISKALPDDRDVTLDWGTETPLRISYDLGDAKIEFIVAPRVGEP